jgi:hypothetical protein
VVEVEPAMQGDDGRGRRVVGERKRPDIRVRVDDVEVTGSPVHVSEHSQVKVRRDIDHLLLRHS